MHPSGIYRLFQTRRYRIKALIAFYGRLGAALLIPVFLLLFFLLPPPLPASAEGETVRIGVLAYKGKEEALRMWVPTGTYLQKNIPEFSFEIIPLTFDQIDDAVRTNAIDFIIANSSLYVGLEARYGVARIATMKNRGLKGTSTVFGGTIFCRAGREDLKTLSDVQGKTFLAVDETSLGGWQAAWREFHAAGINPYKDFRELSFADNHENVVMAIKDGKFDVGTVRTDTLERMANDGKITLKDFLVINYRKQGDFPFLLSTRLYPEWPIARLDKTPEDVAKKVAIALLNLPSDAEAAAAAKIYGWTIPLDYHEVHDLQKELRLGSYKDYGKFTLSQFLRHYWYLPLLVFLAMTVMTLVLLHILKLNRHVLAAKKEAEDSRNSLEQQVIARTAELRTMNDNLLVEVQTRKESEEKLVLAEQQRAEQFLFLQSVIDSIADPVMVISPDYRVTLINQAAAMISGNDTFCYRISHHAASPCNESDHPCPLREVISSKRPVVVVHTHAGPQGEDVLVEITASPIFDSDGNVAHIIEICRDITDRVRQEQLQKKHDRMLFDKQKEKAIATLAGGIAHDFNNILMGILGNAELLKLKVPLKPETSKTIDSIIEGVERMADLTRQMIAYAKEGKYQLRNVLLGNAIKKALEISQKEKATATRIVLSLPGDLWPVLADENQLVQAFVNLVKNAFEATEERGGTLTLVAENIIAKPSWVCEHHNEHPAGDYVAISVSDTGIGIPKTLADKIYEPFVTTKFMGRGLGLSAVYGIIQNHGGCITFSSREGEGTTFHILLPRADHAAPLSIVKKSALLPSANNRILIVDDEKDIIHLLEKALVRLGYDVIAAGSGEEGIESFRTLSDHIETIILDLQLPGMSGKETFKKLKAIKPGVKIIISTGYDHELAMEQMSPYMPDGFIQKPYKQSVLRETLEEIFLSRP